MIPDSFIWNTIAWRTPRRPEYATAKNSLVTVMIHGRTYGLDVRTLLLIFAVTDNVS
jgi:hypothetical protein